MEPHSRTHGASRTETLQELVQHVAHRLPAQGPIGVFIHHNTLHAFQHLPFEQAVVEAGKVYGAQPYMSEEGYRKAVGAGRILIDDIDAVLASEADFPVWPGMTRLELRRRLLVPGIRHFQAETVQWDLDEGGLLDSKESQALFDACLRETPFEDGTRTKHVRPRAGVLAATGTDLDPIVNPWLIRFCAVFTDQGLSYWPMPNREEGLLKASLTLLKQPFCLLPRELNTLVRRSEELAGPGISAEETVARALDTLGVPETEWEATIQAELLALGGWAGMISRLEVEPELAPHEMLPSRLMDFLALRLVLTVAAVDALLPGSGAWRTAKASGEDAFGQRLASAATLFDAATQVEAPVSRLHALRIELDAFHDLERRRILHLAYERRHERMILLPLQEHRRTRPGYETEKLSAQVFFCLDEREESIRRHLEEIAPHVETFGVAGFYGVAMNYMGLDDAYGASMCPVVVKPKHAVVERPVQGQWGEHARRARMRKIWAWVMRQWTVSSRSMVRGWVSTTVLGAFSIFPLAARVLSPRKYAQLVAWLNAGILPEPRTELAFVRTDDGDQETFDLLKGFSVDEKVERVAGLLTLAGLRRGMARLVVTLGHGSTTVNNPHKSAYDCGACGGRRGGPSGRLFAAMANHPAVRAGLRERGIVVPDDTWFIGGYHDTCNDDIELYDLEDLPHTHRRDLADLRALLDEARTRNAHERVRRFEAADWPAEPIDGLHHAQERSEHIAEPRPEAGHCTNAITIIGRRSSTRGLFLDRRAFLVSYDMAQDPTDSSLAGLLGAVIPVCAGIALEYFFSYVDNDVYGCGTKLPHNVAGLLGVMNGYESDLRTGLPWQMVEIHEPVRNLFIIESTPERILKTIQSNALNWEFLSNGWIRLAAMDPATGAMQVYRNGVFEPIEGDDETLASTRSSRDWYRGNRDHLAMARIETGARA